MPKITDNIRRNIGRKKEQKSSSDELKDTINDATNLLLKKFLVNVQSGEVELNDVPDLVRVISLANDVNQWNTDGATGGAPPEISLRQLELLNEGLPTSKDNINGEDIDVIDLDKLEEMTDSDIENLLAEREITYNQENEVTF